MQYKRCLCNFSHELKRTGIKTKHIQVGIMITVLKRFPNLSQVSLIMCLNYRQLNVCTVITNWFVWLQWREDFIRTRNPPNNTSIYKQHPKKKYLYVFCCDIILTPGGEDDEIFTTKILFSDEVTFHLCYTTQL
jgi:hypothetical protein